MRIALFMAVQYFVDMPEKKTERIQVVMAPSDVEAVDDWSFANRVRSRSDAIRRLVHLGIEAWNKQRAADGKPPS